MEVKTYSRKQAGVIYSNVKRGTLSMEKSAISAMYDYAGCAFVSNTNSLAVVEKLAYAIRNAVDAVFAGDLATAQASLDSFAANC